MGKLSIDEKEYNKLLKKVIEIGDDNEVTDYTLKHRRILKKMFVITSPEDMEKIPMTTDTLPFFMLYGEEKPVFDEQGEETGTAPVFSPEKKDPEAFPPETMEQIRKIATRRLCKELDIISTQATK